MANFILIFFKKISQKINLNINCFGLNSMDSACEISTGEELNKYDCRSDIEAAGPEKDPRAVIIESEELMEEIADMVLFSGFPIFSSFR